MRFEWDAQAAPVRPADVRSAQVNHLMPRFIRQFPFNVLLKDLDWRIRTGRPLVCMFTEHIGFLDWDPLEPAVVFQGFR